MNLKVLTLNCQKGHQKSLMAFLHEKLERQEYDFLLLQEANSRILSELIGHNDYSLISASVFPPMADYVMLAIIYKNNYRLNRSEVVKNPTKNIFFRNIGLIGKFETEDHKNLVVATTHQVASLNKKLRSKSLKVFKDKILNFSDNDSAVIFGGDFNCINKGEIGEINGLMLPELTNTRKDERPTYDSRLIEIHNHGSLAIRLVSYIPGLRKYLSLDHFYVDFQTSDRSTIQTDILDLLLSDHKAVELTIAN